MYMHAVLDHPSNINTIYIQIVLDVLLPHYIQICLSLIDIFKFNRSLFMSMYL